LLKTLGVSIWPPYITLLKKPHILSKCIFDASHLFTKEKARCSITISNFEVIKMKSEQKSPRWQKTVQSQRQNIRIVVNDVLTVDQFEDKKFTLTIFSFSACFSFVKVEHYFIWMWGLLSWESTFLWWKKGLFPSFQETEEYIQSNWTKHFSLFLPWKKAAGTGKYLSVPLAFLSVPAAFSCFFLQGTHSEK